MAEKHREVGDDDLTTLIAENEDLKRQVAFFKAAYEEQLRNSMTLADALEERRAREGD